VTTVRATIANGRQGQMPAFLDRLGDTRVRLLAAYVVSLGGVERAPQTAPTAAAAPSP
jgi:cytochrome c oxidase cbb3-type subunit 3